MLHFWRALLAATFCVGMSAAAMADDWVAMRLRGQVVQLLDNAWQPLHRGDVVPDSRVVRTLASGHVDFMRGQETVALGPDTQIQIFDKPGTKPFTTVKEYFGAVSVEAEVENVQHFAVDTPYLAAVVKGTKFVVISGKDGASVTVHRGHVAVDDKASHRHVTIAVGETASVSSGSPGTLTVSGDGATPTAAATGNDPVPAVASDDNSGTSSSTSGAASSGDGGSDNSGSRGNSGSDNSGKGSSGNNGSNGNSGKGNSGDNGNSGKGKSGGSSLITVSVAGLTLRL